MRGGCHTKAPKSRTIRGEKGICEHRKKGVEDGETHLSNTVRGGEGKQPTGGEGRTMRGGMQHYRQKKSKS